MPDSLKRKGRQTSFPGIRDGNRDVISCLSGRSTANEGGNTENSCDCCFRWQGPWVHRWTPGFSRKDILLGGSMPFVFFVSRVLLGSRDARSSVPREVSACCFLLWASVFSEGSEQTKRAPIFMIGALMMADGGKGGI